MAADSFFGFNTQMPAYEDEELVELDPSLSSLRDENFDVRNDDTFGSGAVEDDWEEAHKKLAAITEGLPGLKPKWPPLVDAKEHQEPRRTAREQQDEDEADLEEEEEILEQTLAKLVDEDETEPSKPYASSGYKDIPRVPMPSAWNGSPLSSPTSSSSLHELISPSSNIWASPSRVPVDRDSGTKIITATPSNQSRPGRRPYSPAFEDEAIVKALPKPETLLPPSSFTKKAPGNVIRLEDLEKEFATGRNSPSHQVPDVGPPPLISQQPLRTPQKMATPQQMQTPQQPLRTPQQPMSAPYQAMSTPQPLGRGKPPPGIPHPLIPPPGFSPQMSPSPHMPPHTPQGFTPFPMPPQMFQGRQMSGKQPFPPGMGGPNLMMRTPPPHLQRPPLPMMHSDPGHLLQRGGLLNFQMTPQRHRFSTPQPRPQMYRGYPDNRGHRYDYHGNQYDHRGYQHDRHGNYDQRRGYGHDHYRHLNTPQHSDLENKIHEILTRDEHLTSNDPYAGLMTRREKEWIIKIQLLQLTSSHPELDDFYFQTYIRRKQAKERAQQGEVPQEDQNTNGNAAQTLPQFEREERNYRPLDFRGTLGKVSASSISHPRQMVTIDHISKTSEQDKTPSSTTKDIKRRRQILSAIEKAYDYLLQLDDLEKKMVHADADERNTLLETKQTTGVNLFNLLRLNVRTDSSGKCDDEFFVQLMTIRKGRLLLSRMLPALKQPQADAVLLSLSRNVASVIKKDHQDEVLPRLISPVSHVIENGSSAVVVQSLKNIVQGNKVTQPQTSTLSTLIANQFGLSLLSALLKKCSSVSSSFSDNKGELRQSWEGLVSQVAKEFSETPVKTLSNNLTAVTPLVGVLVGCTSSDVASSLELHYRNAITAKEDTNP